MPVHILQSLDRKLAVERQHVGELEDLIQDLRAARFLQEDLAASAAATLPSLTQSSADQNTTATEVQN